MDYSLPLIHRDEVAEDTMLFTLDRSAVDYTFTAGQYANFALIDPPYQDDEGLDRDFSIASAPESEGIIQFASRMRNTAFKNSLKAIPLGSPVKASRAMGYFTLHQNASQPAVFLAGGIGITPFRSIITSALTKQLPYELWLFYSNRTREATTFAYELSELARTHPNFKLSMTITDEDDVPAPFSKGRITAELIAVSGVSLQESMFYTAGPPAMTEAMRALLIEAGISETLIRTEDFAGY
jgi:ferredoxin-NADP reductase